MSLQYAVQDKENLIANGPVLKQVQKQTQKGPLQKSTSNLQQHRQALGNITNLSKPPLAVAQAKAKPQVLKPALKYTEEREFAYYSKPVAHSDEFIESIDFNQLRSLTTIKPVPSLSALDDFPMELDQEPLAVDEELPSDEFNPAGFDALAPLELEITF